MAAAAEHSVHEAAAAGKREGKPKDKDRQQRVNVGPMRLFFPSWSSEKAVLLLLLLL